MQEITEIYHTRSRTFRVLNKSTLMQLAEHTYAYVTFAHCFPSRNLNLQSLIRDCNLRLLSKKILFINNCKIQFHNNEK